MNGSARRECQWFYRRHCLTMNGFRHREPSSLLDNGRVQTSRAVVIAYFISGSWICSCSVTPWVRLEDSRITSTTILFDDHVWCTTESRNEIIRTRSLSHCQKSEFATPLLTWSSSEHELLASRLDFCIPAWPHRNDLEDHYSRDLRIWQTRVDRDVCRDRLAHLSLSGLLARSPGLAEISVMLWQEPLVDSSHCRGYLSEK